jgi:hypothetical protein
MIISLTMHHIVYHQQKKNTTKQQTSNFNYIAWQGDIVFNRTWGKIENSSENEHE